MSGVVARLRPERESQGFGYCCQTDANKATASQIIPQIPSDNSTITISATPQVSDRPGCHIAPRALR